MDPYILTRDDAFAGLAAAGAARAEVAFHGGNDEGGAESITLYDADGTELHTLEEWYPGHRGSGEPPPTALERLAYTLVRPVYDRYGGFAGDFSVSGVVVWDAAARTVTIEGQESVAQYESFEEEWDGFPDDDREEG